MPDQRLLLTDKSVEKLPLATEGQYFVRDTDLRGFLILVRIPIYPPMHSNAKPPTDSDLKPPSVPI
jgi:hypothetical protein